MWESTNGLLWTFPEDDHVVVPDHVLRAQQRHGDGLFDTRVSQECSGGGGGHADGCQLCRKHASLEKMETARDSRKRSQNKCDHLSNLETNTA